MTDSENKKYLVRDTSSKDTSVEDLLNEMDAKGYDPIFPPLVKDSGGSYFRYHFRLRDAAALPSGTDISSTTAPKISGSLGTAEYQWKLGVVIRLWRHAKGVSEFDFPGIRRKDLRDYEAGRYPIRAELLQKIADGIGVEISVLQRLELPPVEQLKRGDIVAAWMVYRGMNIGQLADRASLKHLSLEKFIEGFVKEPTIETMESLARALGVTMDDLKRLPPTDETAMGSKHSRDYARELVATIRSWRKHRELAIFQLAAQIDVTIRDLEAIEAGEMSVADDTLQLIAAALRVNVDTLKTFTPVYEPD